MYPNNKFGIPTSKNIGDMDRTRKRDGHTDGRTVRLLYASQSSFGGIKYIQGVAMVLVHDTECHLLFNKADMKLHLLMFHFKGNNSINIQARVMDLMHSHCLLMLHKRLKFHQNLF